MQPITLILNPRAAERIRRGYPWVFRSDVVNAKEAGSFDPGAAVFFSDRNERRLATGYAHPSAQLMGRVLAVDHVAINADMFHAKFTVALAWRDQLFKQAYYRLVHAESDYLPGLIIDRFDDTLVVQVNTAGMERLQPVWLPVLQAVLPVKNIILKNDSAGRALEHLPEKIEIAKGKMPPDNLVEVIENDTYFYADIREGQKTGWFFDQRPHRKWVADASRGKSVMDVFCHTGGFGVTAGKAGASHITFVDASAPALALAQKNAALNHLAACDYREGKAFDILAETPPRSYDIVCVDPPAFVKVKKDMAVGLKGYEKLARLAASVVKPGGILFYASCSSHPSEKEVLDAIFTGISKAGRQASLVYTGTAGPDHPVHPMLPETRYLKAFGFRIL